MGQLCFWLWPMEMLVMTDKQEFQLVAPLVAGGGCFVLLLLATRLTGDLNRYTWKALLSGRPPSDALDPTFWQNELTQMWLAWPLVLVFGLLLSLTIPCGLFLWIWHVQVAAKADRVAAAAGSRVQIVKTDSSSTKLFRSVVLAWGTINLLALVVAIIHAFLGKP